MVCSSFKLKQERLLVKVSSLMAFADRTNIKEDFLIETRRTAWEQMFKQVVPIAVFRLGTSC